MSLLSLTFFSLFFWSFETQPTFCCSRLTYHLTRYLQCQGRLIPPHQSRIHVYRSFFASFFYNHSQQQQTIRIKQFYETLKGRHQEKNPTTLFLNLLNNPGRRSAKSLSVVLFKSIFFQTIQYTEVKVTLELFI